MSETRVAIDKIEKEVELHITTGESQIHLVKYEMIKNMIETVLTEDGEIDENMGMKSNEVSIPFKLSFNSLLSFSSSSCFKSVPN